MGGIEKQDRDRAAEAVMKDPLYQILTYERGSTGVPDPRSLPELTREEFRQWAARLYSHQASSHQIPIFGKSHGPVSKSGAQANERFLKWSRRAMRLIAAGLFARAVEREWPEVAQRWADTYWKGCEERPGPDREDVLDKARLMILQKEYAERAWKINKQEDRS